MSFTVRASAAGMLTEPVRSRRAIRRPVLTLASEPKPSVSLLAGAGGKKATPVVDDVPPPVQKPASPPPMEAKAPEPQQPMADDSHHALFAAYLDALIRSQDAGDPESKDAADEEADHLWSMLHGEDEQAELTATFATGDSFMGGGDEEGSHEEPHEEQSGGGWGGRKPRHVHDPDKPWREFRGDRGGWGAYHTGTGDVIYNRSHHSLNESHQRRMQKGGKASPENPYPDWMVKGEKLTPELKADIDRRRARLGLAPPGQVYNAALHGPGGKHQPPQQVEVPKSQPKSTPPPLPQPQPAQQAKPTQQPSRQATLLPDDRIKHPHVDRLHAHFSQTHSTKSDEQIGHELGRIIGHYPPASAKAIASRYGLASGDSLASIGKKIRGQVAEKSQDEHIDLVHTSQSDLPEGVPTKADPHGLVWYFPRGEQYGSYGGKEYGLRIPKGKVLDTNDPEVLKDLMASLPAGTGRTKAGDFAYAKQRGYLAVKRGSEVAMEPHTAKSLLGQQQNQSGGESSQGKPQAPAAESFYRSKTPAQIHGVTSPGLPQPKLTANQYAAAARDAIAQKKIVEENERQRFIDRNLVGPRQPAWEPKPTVDKQPELPWAEAAPEAEAVQPTGDSSPAMAKQSQPLPQPSHGDLIKKIAAAPGAKKAGFSADMLAKLPADAVHQIASQLGLVTAKPRSQPELDLESTKPVGQANDNDAYSGNHNARINEAQDAASGLAEIGGKGESGLHHEETGSLLEYSPGAVKEFVSRQPKQSVVESPSGVIAAGGPSDGDIANAPRIDVKPKPPPSDDRGWEHVPLGGSGYVSGTYRGDSKPLPENPLPVGIADPVREAMQRFLKDNGYEHGPSVPAEARPALTAKWIAVKDKYIQPTQGRYQTVRDKQEPAAAPPSPSPAAQHPASVVKAAQIKFFNEHGYKRGKDVPLGLRDALQKKWDETQHKYLPQPEQPSPAQDDDPLAALRGAMPEREPGDDDIDPLEVGQSLAAKRAYGHEHRRLREQARQAGFDPDEIQGLADEHLKIHNQYAEVRNELLRRAREISYHQARENRLGAYADPKNRKAVRLQRYGPDGFVAGSEDAAGIPGFDEITESIRSLYPDHFFPETGEHGHHTDQLYRMLQEGNIPLMTPAQAFQKAWDQADEERYRRLADEQEGKTRPPSTGGIDDEVIPFSTESDIAIFSTLASLPESIQFVTLMNNDGWERYGPGPRGGQGWRHQATGRIVYTRSENAPGSRRRQQQVSQQRASELGSKYAAHHRNGGEPLTEAEIRELSTHIQALPVHQLRSLKNLVMGTWGNARRRQHMVDALTSHVQGKVSKRRQAAIPMPSAARTSSGPGLFDDLEEQPEIESIRGGELDKQTAIRREHEDLAAAADAHGKPGWADMAFSRGRQETPAAGVGAAAPSVPAPSPDVKEESPVVQETREPAQESPAVDPEPAPPQTPEAAADAMQAEGQQLTREHGLDAPHWSSLDVGQYKYGGSADEQTSKQLADSYASLPDRERTLFAEQFGIENAARALPETRDDLVNRKIRELAFKHGRDVAPKGGSLFGERGVGESGGLFDDVSQEGDEVGQEPVENMPEKPVEIPGEPVKNTPKELTVEAIKKAQDDAAAREEEEKRKEAEKKAPKPSADDSSKPDTPSGMSHPHADLIKNHIAKYGVHGSMNSQQDSDNAMRAAGEVVEKLQSLDQPTLLKVLTDAGIEGHRPKDKKSSLLQRAYNRMTAGARAYDRAQA